MSNIAMSHPIPTTSTTDQRLTDLEIKATYTEELLEQLDAVIIRQQQQMDQLFGEVAALRQSNKDAGTGLRASGEHHLRDDLPPHF